MTFHSISRLQSRPVCISHLFLPRHYFPYKFSPRGFHWIPFPVFAWYQSFGSTILKHLPSPKSQEPKAIITVPSSSKAVSSRNLPLPLQAPPVLFTMLHFILSVIPVSNSCLLQKSPLCSTSYPYHMLLPPHFFLLSRNVEIRAGLERQTCCRWRWQKRG